jgi:hypothetical protein
VGLRIIVFTVGLLVLLAQTGCGSEGTNDASSGDDQPAASDTQPTSPQPATTSADSDARQIVGTTVRVLVEHHLGGRRHRRGQSRGPRFPLDAPSDPHRRGVRGPRKVSYLPRELRHRGSPGSDSESGDLIYFVPWGNLGFYYNAEGIGYSDDTIHLGTYDASLDQLERLEGEVTVEVND